MTGTAPEQTSRTRSRLTLVLLAVLFAAPLFLAWLAQDDGLWRDRPKVNYGELIQPIRPLDALRLQRRDGTPVGPAQLRGHWTLVYLPAGDCASSCGEVLYKIRQTHAALGKEMDRVQRLLILGGSMTAQGPSEELIRNDPNLIVADADPDEWRRLGAWFAPPRGEFSPGESVYLVDPLGNLMMSYPTGFEMKGMLTDLKRLLKASFAG